jgi:hypothetical protein
MVLRLGRKVDKQAFLITVARWAAGKEAPDLETPLFLSLKRKFSFRGTVQKAAVPCGFDEGVT